MKSRTFPAVFFVFFLSGLVLPAAAPASTEIGDVAEQQASILAQIQTLKSKKAGSPVKTEVFIVASSLRSEAAGNDGGKTAVFAARKVLSANDFSGWVCAGDHLCCSYQGSAMCLVDACCHANDGSACCVQ